MVPVCDKRYHIYNRFRHFWADIKKLWNYPFSQGGDGTHDTCLQVWCSTNGATRAQISVLGSFLYITVNSTSYTHPVEISPRNS